MFFGDLTFKGSGKLNATGGRTIHANNVTIESGTVVATGNEQGYATIGADTDITIKGGNVEATSTNNVGISAVNKVMISAGSVKAAGAYGGINALNGGVTINNGTVEATATFIGYGISGGDNSVEIINGQVIASGVSRGIKGTVKNSIAGTGWADSTGTGAGTPIAVNKTGAELSYKKVQFPAVTSYSLWIGNQQVDDDHLSGQGWSYDKDNNVLTLDGADISGENGNCTQDEEYDLNCGTIRTKLSSLTINVKSDSTVTGPGTNDAWTYSYGIYARGCDLTITGNGKLTVADSSDKYSYGVSAKNIIVNGKLSAKGESTKSEPCSYGVYADTSITINEGAELTAIGRKYGKALGGINGATLKNAVAGTGWTNAEGTEVHTNIAVNTTGQDLSSLKDYKKVKFPAFEPVASVTPSGGHTTEYDDFAAAVNAWNEASKRGSWGAKGATLKLLADVKTSSTVSVTEGANDSPMVLDLNGYGICYTGTENNSVIKIGFSGGDKTACLKLIDNDKSSRKHYITLDSNGRGTAVSDKTSEGAFEVTGGYITGGLGNSGYGGGIYSAGNFVMEGGTIVGNTADQGGGVYAVGTSKFTMNGGTITGNKASDKGGGVYTSSGITIKLSGGAVITGNKKGNVKNNLQLPNNKTIEITDALNDTASVGVTMEQVGVFTRSTSTIKASDYKGCFSSDDSTYSVMTEGNELKLSAHEHSFTYTASGDTITAACSAEGCPLPPSTQGGSDHVAKLTIAAPQHTTYGDGNDAAAQITDANSIQGEAKIKYFKTDADGKKTGDPLSAAPTDAGKYWAEITLGPEGKTATAHVVYTIAKATPTITTVPTAAAITYGETLANSKLTGGTAIVGDLGILGAFTWKDGTIKPSVADSETTDYDVVFTPNDSVNYNTAECKVKLTANSKEVALEWTGTKLTYNGKAQKPKARVANLEKGDECTVTVDGEQTDANAKSGKDYYEAEAKALSNDNYKLPEKVKTKFTISPRSISGAAVTLDKTQLTYSGSEQSVSVTEVSLDGVKLTEADYDVSGNKGTNKGDYTVKVTGKGNYKDSATADWKIVGKAMTVEAEPVTAKYDGNEYGITVNVTDPSSGTTTKFGTKEGTYDLNESPKFKAAGTHNVYFKVSGNDDYDDYTGNATVTISKKAVTSSVSAEDKTYDGKTDATVSASVKAEDLIRGDSVEITGLKGSFADANAGEDKKVSIDSSAAEVSGTGSDNYVVTIPEETTASVSKAAPDVTAPGAKTLTYSGKAQGLVNAGKAKGGEMQYALGENANVAPGEGWGTDIPTGTDVGDYYVWFKVIGDDNHNNTDPVCVTVRISEKKPEPVSKATITYDLNGGTLNGKTGVVTITEDIGTVITLPAPTRDGYTFDYWEGSKYNAGDKYTVNGDHTFKAVWKTGAGGNGKGGSSKGGTKTGDPNDLAGLIALMLAAGGALGAMGYRRRKER